MTKPHMFPNKNKSLVMHPKLQEIADRYGIPISNRSCHNGYMWDGRTLSIHHQKEKWDDDFHRGGGKLISLSEPIYIGDSWAAHEIAHWVVATPTERSFPEYGCTIGIVPFGATGGIRWDKVKYGSQEWKALESIQEGVLTRKEQNFREVCADLLGTYWCDCFNIPVIYEARPINKIINSIKVPSSYSIEEGWRAIIWLREHNLIP